MPGHDVALAGNIVNNASLVCNLNGSETSSGIISGIQPGEERSRRSDHDRLQHLSSATTISAGTLQLGDGTAGHDGTLAGDIVNNFVLAYDLNGNQTYAGAIGGSGECTKSGPGMLTFSGVNTYTGPTVINGGTLKLAPNGSGNLNFYTNLQVYYQFEGNGADASGNGRNLVLYGGAGFGPGLFGQGLALQGNPNQFANARRATRSWTSDRTPSRSSSGSILTRPMNRRSWRNSPDQTVQVGRSRHSGQAPEAPPWSLLAMASARSIPRLCRSHWGRGTRLSFGGRVVLSTCSLMTRSTRR